MCVFLSYHLWLFSSYFDIKRLAECIILFRKSMIATASLDSVTTVWGKNIGISSVLDFSSECLVSLSVNVKMKRCFLKSPSVLKS